jgi:ferredoxin-NADP reductase
MEITLQSSTNLVDDIWQFQFTRPAALTFDAGDYVELGLNNVGGRWLSIASSPSNSNSLDFITKISDQRSKFKQKLQQLTPGDNVIISPAIGNFNLPRSDNKHLLWVAGGIGITPYLSMARWLADQTERKPTINLFYAANPNQHIFIDELKSIVHDVTKQETRPLYEQLQPFITDQNIIYLSGPQPLCEQLNESLLGSGVKRSRIKLDYFEGYDTL